ncbi:hypothetical protein KM043_009231 [Ampulex compressa]|nr:hypothetical protein KM043_009231 [Ampulex compressa]
MTGADIDTSRSWAPREPVETYPSVVGHARLSWPSSDPPRLYTLLNISEPPGKPERRGTLSQFGPFANPFAARPRLLLDKRRPLSHRSEGGGLAAGWRARTPWVKAPEWSVLAPSFGNRFACRMCRHTGSPGGSRVAAQRPGHPPCGLEIRARKTGSLIWTFYSLLPGGLLEEDELNGNGDGGDRVIAVQGGRGDLGESTFELDQARRGSLQRGTPRGMEYRFGYRARENETKIKRWVKV